jgi:choline dehydrogenase
MFDYVVVGAGSAGCVLANRLSEDPAARVLLLEAGPPDRRLEIHVPAAWIKLFKTRYDWAYATEPEPALGGRSLYWPRGRTLGGTSSINAQMYLRGHRADFDGWAALGNAGWRYDQVLPYFRRAERNQRGPSAWHGAAGPLDVADQRDPSPLSRDFVDAAMRAGLARNDDFNGAELDGAGLVQVTQRRGRRCSTAVAYLRPARRRRNLTVVTGAHATRVMVERGRAVGVEYVAAGRAGRALAAGEVVLSGGAVASPQLLMLSGVGPAAHLRAHGIRVLADLPGVGRNLQDHVAAPMRARINRPLSLAAVESPANLVRWLTRRTGMMSSNVIEAAAFARTRPGLEAPDVELMFGPVLWIDPQDIVMPTEHGVTVAPVVLQPRSRGAVELRSADPSSNPRSAPAPCPIPAARTCGRSSRASGSPCGSSTPRRCAASSPSAPSRARARRRSARSSAGMPIPPGTPPAPARWASTTTPWSILSCGCAAWTACGWWTPRSCR